LALKPPLFLLPFNNVGLGSDFRSPAGAKKQKTKLDCFEPNLNAHLAARLAFAPKRSARKEGPLSSSRMFTSFQVPLTSKNLKWSCEKIYINNK
jgi:hypothetical protein